MADDTTATIPRTSEASGTDSEAGGAAAMPPTAAADVLAAVRRMAPAIAARAEEVEAARRLPLDLVDDLRAAGCFGVLVPASHGGAGAALPDAMRVVEELSRIEASVGWTVMIGAGSWVDLAGLPRETFDAIYADGPGAIVAGAFNPSGTAAPVEGGYRVSGRWAFVSGCQHASWLWGNCIEEGKAAGDGLPPVRTVLFSPDEVTIEDTWSVSGLCGTGSHHIRVDGVVVPAARTVATFVDPPGIDEPVVRIPPPALYSLLVTSAAVGIAQAAYDDVVDIATGKVPMLARSPLASNPLFQHRLGTMDAQLRAARSLLYADAAAAWDTAVEREELTLGQRARIRGATTWATATAASVVDAAYAAGGGSSIYAGNPLQRRFRDVHALTQHFLVRADTLTTAGAVLAGQEIDVPVF